MMYKIDRVDTENQRWVLPKIHEDSIMQAVKNDTYKKDEDATLLAIIPLFSLLFYLKKKGFQQLKI